MCVRYFCHYRFTYLLIHYPLSYLFPLLRGKRDRQIDDRQTDRKRQIDRDMQTEPDRIRDTDQ